MRRLSRLYNNLVELIDAVVVVANDTVGSGCLWAVVAAGAAVGVAMIWLAARLFH